MYSSTKSIFASRTFWLAVLFGAVNVAGLFGFADFSPSGDVSEIVGIVVSVVAIVVRLRTNQPVSLSGN